MLLLTLKDIYGNIHTLSNKQDYNPMLSVIENKVIDDENIYYTDIENGIFKIINVLCDDFNRLININCEYSENIKALQIYDIIDTYNNYMENKDTKDIYKIIAYLETYKNFENAFSQLEEKIYIFKDTPVNEIIWQVCNYYEDEDENNLYKAINYLSHIHPNTLNTQGVIDFLNIQKSDYVDNLYYIVAEY